MKYLLFLIILVSFSRCLQESNQIKSKKVETQFLDTLLEYYKIDTIANSEISRDFKKYKLYKLSTRIQADFNGDNKIDKAIFTSRNNKSGIIISDGKTHKETLFGCGQSFGEMGDSFSWVDYWGLLLDSSTYNIIVKGSELVGSENIKLENPSIFVRKKEVGGGVITFKKGKYIWVHQSD